MPYKMSGEIHTKDFLVVRRMIYQKLIAAGSMKPAALVHHMLCMQSQDLTQAKRAIASRAGCSEQDIIDAFNAGEIVRTRTQRGTIHTLCAEDVGRMVQLCASKTLGGFKKRREYLGITDLLLEHMQEVVLSYVHDGPKTRIEISTALLEAGIDMQPNRIYHILCYLGTQGHIVQGPFTANEQAFVLTQHRIPGLKHSTEEESVKNLCFRYFSSHGPATILDLQRRSGLGITKIKQGIALCGDDITHTDGYYFVDTGKIDTIEKPHVHFLAGFDERLLGYKDRAATLDNTHKTKIDASSNGVFKPTIMIDGKTVGIRSVKHKAKCDEVYALGFSPFSSQELVLLQEHIGSYQVYRKKPIQLLFGV